MRDDDSLTKFVWITGGLIVGMLILAGVVMFAKTIDKDRLVYGFGVCLAVADMVLGWAADRQIPVWIGALAICGIRDRLDFIRYTR
jgi:hypothetical protein